MMHLISADTWGAILTLIVAIPAVAALIADHHRDTEGRDTMDYEIDSARADDDGMALARD
jgi:hypothetical protein